MQKKIFFGSDTHFGHANIIRLCNRPFSNIYEHDETLISNYNKKVSDNDDYYFLGDFAYKCSRFKVEEILRRLNGKIHVILGNHDKSILDAIESGLLDDLLDNGKLEIYGLKSILEDRTLSISKTLYIDNQTIFMSHYQCSSYPHAFRNAIHLFGHQHYEVKSPYRKINVSVDATGFSPISYEEILQRLANSKSFQED
jgi:calcineurin-like phosphoesterase family protein